MAKKLIFSTLEGQSWAVGPMVYSLSQEFSRDMFRQTLFATAGFRPNHLGGKELVSEKLRPVTGYRKPYVPTETEYQMSRLRI